MEFGAVGASGVRISRVGLGGYQLGPEPEESPDVDRAARVVEAAIASGVNWLDTSESYLGTRNEDVIGAALERVGKEFLVVSKVAPRAGITGGGSGFRREQVLQACHDSLTRIRRDYPWGAMAELVDVGLVRAIGLSNYDLADVERCHAQRPVDAVQVGLNLIDYLDHRSYVARCAELGVAVTIYEPVAGGVLAGKTLVQVRAAWPGPWRESRWYKRILAPGPGERSLAVADGLRPIAESLNATVAQVAIAWVLHQPGVTAAIAGSRDGTHMRENAVAAALDLSGVLSEIERLIPLGPLFGSTVGAG